MVIKVYPEGNVSQHMFSLNVGDEVMVSLVSGVARPSGYTLAWSLSAMRAGRN